MQKKVVFLFVALSVLVNVSLKAQLTHFDFLQKNGKSKIYYKITDKQNAEVEVTYKNRDFASYKGSVIIPDTVRWRGKTYNVTSIGDSAFFGCGKLDTVSLGNNIKSVGKDVFTLSAFTELHISPVLEQIGERAFANCSSITDFTVGNSVKNIGDYAFAGSGLQNLVIDCGNLQVNKAFTDVTSLKKITFSQKVKTINPYIFDNCTNIDTVIYFAENFEGFSPFDGHKSIRSIEIGNRVRSLPENFVRNCVNINEVKLPEGLKTISSHAFAGTGIEEIVLFANIEQMGVGIFKDCSKLKKVILPDNLGVIVDNMFEGCENLTDIYMPEMLAEIDTAAFKNCKSLTSIIFHESIESIGEEAFSGCNRLKNITISTDTPPYAADNAGFLQDAEISIDCSSLLTYKNDPYWKNFNYACDLGRVTVQSTQQRDVFDKTRNRTFTEKVLNTGDLSYIITNERNKTVSVIAPETSFRDDLTKHTEIPSQIADGDILYTVTGIESLGVCQSVYIPATVKTINEDVFSSMDLEAVYVDQANTSFTASDGVIYSADQKILIAYPAAKAAKLGKNERIILPDETQIISKGAFVNADKAVVQIGKNIKKIYGNQQVQGFYMSPNDAELNGNILIKDNEQIVYYANNSSVMTAVKNYTPKGRVLVIEENITEEIDDYAFFSAKFDTLKVSAKTPVVIHEHTFDLTKSFICIVPNGTLNAYKNEKYWNQMNLAEQKPAKSAKKQTSRKKK